MTAPGRATQGPGPRQRRLLAILLIGVMVLPVLVFVTNLPERGPMVAARRAAMARAGVPEIPDSIRMALQLERRRQIRPTPGGASAAIALQLFWVVVVGVVGRRGFNLRL